MVLLGHINTLNDVNATRHGYFFGRIGLRRGLCFDERLLSVSGTPDPIICNFFPTDVPRWDDGSHRAVLYRGRLTNTALQERALEVHFETEGGQIHAREAVSITGMDNPASPTLEHGGGAQAHAREAVSITAIATFGKGAKVVPVTPPTKEIFLRSAGTPERVFQSSGRSHISFGRNIPRAVEGDSASILSEPGPAIVSETRTTGRLANGLVWKKIVWDDPTCPFNLFWYSLVFSDPGSLALDFYLNEDIQYPPVGERFPGKQVAIFDAARLGAIPVLEFSTNTRYYRLMNAADAQERSFIDGQMCEWWGAELKVSINTLSGDDLASWNACISDPIIWSTFDGWPDSGAFGWNGIVPPRSPHYANDQGFRDWVDAIWTNHNTSGQAYNVQIGNPWYGQRSLNVPNTHSVQNFFGNTRRVGDGGGRGALWGNIFATWPIARTAYPKYLKILCSDVRQDLSNRAVHHREADGSIFRWSRYSQLPNVCLMIAGRPALDYCRGNGNLGKTTHLDDNLINFPGHGYSDMADSHWSLNYSAGYHYLTGDPGIGDMLQDCAECFFASQSIDSEALVGNAGHTIFGNFGQGRQVYRAMQAAVHLYMCFGRADILGHLNAKMDITLPKYSAGARGPINALVRPMVVQESVLFLPPVPDPNRWWAPHHNGWVTDALFMVWAITGNPRAFHYMQEAGNTSVKYGWEFNNEQANRWNMGSFIAYKNGNPANPSPTCLPAQVGNPSGCEWHIRAGAAYDMIWTMSHVRIMSVYGDAATRQRCSDIMAGLNWPTRGDDNAGGPDQWAAWHYIMP